jgi:hypothetical protein
MAWFSMALPVAACLPESETEIRASCGEVQVESWCSVIVATDVNIKETDELDGYAVNNSRLTYFAIKGAVSSFSRIKKRLRLLQDAE